MAGGRKERWKQKEEKKEIRKARKLSERKKERRTILEETQGI